MHPDSIARQLLRLAWEGLRTVLGALHLRLIHWSEKPLNVGISRSWSLVGEAFFRPQFVVH